jgi:hypothetical protein
VSRFLVFLALACLVPFVGVVVGACTSSNDDVATNPPRDGAAAADRIRLPQPIHIDAGDQPDGARCDIVVDTPPLLPPSHVTIPTDVTYSSNPPSSGPHYPIWAAWQEFQTPVDRRYYVHNLEHGGTVVAYKCDAPGGNCPQMLQTLRDAIAALPPDPACDPARDGTRFRVVLTADPQLDIPIAAAAWGWIYRAQCADPKSLTDFLAQHVGKAFDLTGEETCANGQTQF